MSNKRNALHILSSEEENSKRLKQDEIYQRYSTIYDDMTYENRKILEVYINDNYKNEINKFEKNISILLTIIESFHGVFNNNLLLISVNKKTN